MLNVAPFNHDMPFNLFKLSVISFSFEIMVSLYCVIPSMECPLFPINLMNPSTYFNVLCTSQHYNLVARCNFD